MPTNPIPDIVAFLIFVALPWAIALALEAIQEKEYYL
jgi:hypothetical protein